MRSIACALCVALVATGAAGQQHRVAVAPDSITVGAIFRVAVRLTVPLEEQVLFPDTLDVPVDVEAAARLDLVVDTSSGAGHTFTAIWALTAWRPGRLALPPVQYRIRRDGVERGADAALPPLDVLSVLPVDTAGVEPMPARDVLGPDRLMWPLFLLLALAGAAIAGGVWAWRRWRPRPAPVLLPALPPRVNALRALDQLRARGLLESGDVKAFIFELTAIIRMYMAGIEPAWSTDLTTAEVCDRMASAVAVPGSGGARDGDVPDRIETLLSRADLVKFARRPMTAAEAGADFERAWRWVESFVWPPATGERAA